ncbi:hypothetical protein [Phaeodactylibacter luteus]|uniref:Uncharacterized protein n=1 Tax=Phaeodactylibacter luteus TaxID=1564516 RepID=A0A5C6S1V8_9BACT|nr:hypothetical protein [Phaeodactylibacter luteus]TXB68373.1 hypothetical protein FRY97_03060 [Phaeodactylibacter luteus]
MKNSTPSSSATGLSSIFKLLGAIFALILTVGALDRAGVRLVQEQENRAAASYMEAPAHAQSGAAPAPEPRFSTVARSRAGRAQAAPTNLADWAHRFATTARQQALEKGVPAGIALACGLQAIQNGQELDSREAFIEQVIDPLAQLKSQAPRTALSEYFKYAANSEKWAAGLSRYSHYEQQDLLEAIRQYELFREDEAVLAAILQRADIEERAGQAAAKVAERIGSTSRPETGHGANASNWRAFYQEEVGQEVARKAARQQLKAGHYLDKNDLEALAEEANNTTQQALSKNIGLLGRPINRQHPEAEKMLDITKPENVQAREELYQQKLRELGYAKGNRK